jgi:hypothetical protein
VYLTILTTATDLLASTTEQATGTNIGDTILVVVGVIALIASIWGLVAYTRRQRNADERSVSLAHDPQLRLEPYKTMSITAPGQPTVGGTVHLVLCNRGQSEAYNIRVKILQWDRREQRTMHLDSIDKNKRGSLGVLHKHVRFVEADVTWETVDGKTIRRKLTWKP